MKGQADRPAGRGEFFAIDRRRWEQVCDLGLNEAVAYLVLAQGTGRDNLKTSWSVTSLKNHAGMSWDRGWQAVTHLIGKAVLCYGEGHTNKRPRYELLRWEEDPPLAGTTFAGPPEHLIWLPNSIVTGTDRGEDSPVRRLRAAGDIWALRLFVDFYHAQNLRDDGGISPRVLRLKYDRRRIGEQGIFVLWAFREGDFTSSWIGPLKAHMNRKADSGEEPHPIWQSVEILTDMGLLKFVPHLWESESEQAEVIHPYGISPDCGESLEQELGTAAHLACTAMALEREIIDASSEGFDYRAPVKKCYPNVQMIGVVRLTYRPHTARTSEWFRELANAAPKFIEEYRDLEQTAQASQQRAARKIG